MDVTKACRDINELTQNAKIACELFLKKCKEKGLNVLITETYRSQERQDYLFEQGRTRPGNVVTWTHNSRHTSRRAWDICKNVKGHEYDDSAFFKACGEIAKSLGIIWGGSWKTPDTPHFEIELSWENPIKESEVKGMNEIEIKKFNGLVEAVENLSAKATESESEQKSQNAEICSLRAEVKALKDVINALMHPMIYNYNDKNVPQWFKEGVSFCYDNGIINGVGKDEAGNDLLGLDNKDLKICTMLMNTCKLLSNR